MSVGDVSVNNGNSRLQHVLDDRQRLCRRGIKTQRLEAGDRNAVVIGDATESRSNILEPEQSLIASVAARFIRQLVGDGVGVGGADGVLERAMDSRSFEIIRLVGFYCRTGGFHCLRRACAEDLDYVERRALEDNILRRKGPDRAARASKGYP